MKIVQIGCNHAGTWAAKMILKNKDKDTQLVIYDKNDNTSFLGCGIALWVSGDVKDPNGLFYSSPEEIRGLGADLKIKHEVINVNVEKKEIEIKNLETNKTFFDSYDKLIIGSGSWPIIPKFPGIDLKNILISKWYQHAQTIVDKNNDPNVKNVTVIGGGYIGVELAEAFAKFGKNVTFIERSPHILNTVYDKEILTHVEKAIVSSGINLRTGESVCSFEGNSNNEVTKVITDKNVYDTDLVIMAIGFHSSTDFIKNKVEMERDGSIKVNEFFQSSNKDIYAIGDSVMHKYNPTQSHKPVRLATNAVRSGLVAGLNVLTSNTLPFNGIQGTHAISVFSWHLAGTGITEEIGINEKINVDSVLIEDYDVPEFMASKSKVWFKVIFNKDTEEIIGAQIASQANHAEVMYMMSLAIQKKVKISELGLIDTYFLPHFNKPINFITAATLKYLKII